MDLPELNEWLNGFMNFERRPDRNMLNLSTMEILCDYFGHPESVCPCFHIAGSKGKGTISHGIAAILRANGFKTGVYASPHVYHFTERVSTGEKPFKKEIYDKAAHELYDGINELIKKGQLEKEATTWYELVTIYAMLVFRLAEVDYAVYEVGMGGRLDCTNIIRPKAIAMGPIELEHTEFLGDTLEKIAAEKAGVFKVGVPVFSAPQKPEVAAVFKSKAAAKQAEVLFIKSQHDYLSDDAFIAAKAVRSVLPKIDFEKAVEIAKSVKLPGRYEIIKNKNSFLLLDGAHTINSVSALISRLKNEKIKGNLLFACAADKNVEKIASLIIKSGLFNSIYLTRPGDFKKSDLPRAEEAFKKAIKASKVAVRFLVSPDYEVVIATALKDSAKTPLITFGSFYILPETKRGLKKRASALNCR